MLTKSEFLAALKRETRILTHLSRQLKPKHLAFRFTPPQRSTLELLQYLTISAQAGVGWFLNGNWDHWDALEAQAKTVSLPRFPVALAAQQKKVGRLLAKVSEKDWATRRVTPMSGVGKGPVLGVALFESTLTTCIGYRMQLFLQAKAAGLARLKSSDLWHGRA